MADAQDSTVEEEIGSSRTGTGDGSGGGGDGGSSDAPIATIATRPDLIVGLRRFKLASLVASEGYNIGWCAHAIFAFEVPGGGASRIDILATLADRGLSPGRRGKVNLRVEAEGNQLLHNQTIRTWPCMVSQMVPLDSDDDTRAVCRIQLVDPLGYLAGREIWGAFRDVSAAELVGGAIALAAGLDAGPTTEVATVWLPKIRVRGRHRDALDVIPYAIATGETLGEWLARVLGTLGLRAELFAEDGGDTQVVYLTDALAHRTSYEMHVERDGAELSDDERGRDGGVSIRSRVAFPGNPLRGALLDDPTQGTPRLLAAFGPIGRVVRAQGADTDEVTERAWHEVRRGFCEALMVRAASGHPGIEPGCTITLNETINRIDQWQVASARHLVSEGAYDNDATLLRADTAWHPPEPEPRRLRNPSPEADTLETPTPPEDRWPPRIALPVVEQMAGAMHSFVGGHRQGDICRVAVHDPFTAEIVGYQYRDNRAINRDVVGAAAAILVEHNYEDAWSGIVLRRIEDMDDAESDETSEDATEEEGAEEPESTDAAPEAPATQTPESLTESDTGGSDPGSTIAENTAAETSGGAQSGAQ